MPPSGPAGRHDVWTAGGLAALALAYLFAAHRYALDTLATPGPGVFPLLLGALLLFLAVCQMVALVRTRRSGMAGGGGGALPARHPIREKRGDAVAAEPAPRHRTPLLMIGALGLYAASVTLVGFLAASGLLVVVGARLMGARGWWRAVLLAVGVVAGTHLLFAVWLGVPLPAGRFR